MAKQDDEQVRDTGTEQLSGDEVANAAAETLHGEQAAEEVRPQPDATVLPGGQTLIADDAPGEPDPSRVDRDRR
jgi:hypothetical protein